MKIVVNRGTRSFNPDTCPELMDELVKRGWKVTTWDNKYTALDDTAYIFLNKANYLSANTLHKDGIDAFENKIRTNKDFIEIIDNNLIPQLRQEYPELEIIEIPDDIKWYIEEDIESGGFEEIHESHRVW